MKNLRNANSKSVKRIFDPVLFWDARSRDIDLSKHSHYVMERVLNYGTSKELNKLRSIYSDKEIIAVVKTNRAILPKTAIFWATYFSIPLKDIKCLNKQFLAHL